MCSAADLKKLLWNMQFLNINLYGSYMLRVTDYNYFQMKIFYFL